MMRENPSPGGGTAPRRPVPNAARPSVSDPVNKIGVIGRGQTQQPVPRQTKGLGPGPDATQHPVAAQQHQNFLAKHGLTAATRGTGAQARFLAGNPDPHPARRLGLVGRGGHGGGGGGGQAPAVAATPPPAAVPPPVAPVPTPTEPAPAVDQNNPLGISAMAPPAPPGTETPPPALAAPAPPVVTGVPGVPAPPGTVVPTPTEAQPGTVVDQAMDLL